MLITALAALAALCIAFANGANDNPKGVATLLGSGTMAYRPTLLWGTVTTLLGSVASVLVATRLVAAFSGKGLVPDALVGQQLYIASVALGAAGTVLLASRLGMPISTTHALLGAMVGAGLSSGATINLAGLGSTFIAPLLLSPLIAVAATAAVYPLCSRLRQRWGIEEETCFCVGQQSQPVAVAGCLSRQLALAQAQRLTAALGTEVVCKQRYGGRVAGVPLASVVAALHYLSAGAVSFARGLNDTPKITALLVAGATLSRTAGGLAAAVVMAVGGVVMARRVMQTLSRKITPMNAGQGLMANAATASIVIIASLFGAPVSTTHVSCGAILGVGTVRGSTRWRMAGAIAASWVLTLPLSALLAAGVYRVVS